MRIHFRSECCTADKSEQSTVGKSENSYLDEHSHTNNVDEYSKINCWKGGKI